MINSFPEIHCELVAHTGLHSTNFVTLNDNRLLQDKFFFCMKFMGSFVYIHYTYNLIKVHLNFYENVCNVQYDSIHILNYVNISQHIKNIFKDNIYYIS